MKAVKYLLLAGCLGFSAQLWALDFPWLSFKMKDASEITVAADNLVMNYSAGNLLLTSGSVNETLSIANIASMSFTANPSQVEEINASLSEAATYYSLDGSKAGEFASADDARRALPSGIYVAKTASKSFKVIF